MNRRANNAILFYRYGLQHFHQPQAAVTVQPTGWLVQENYCRSSNQLNPCTHALLVRMRLRLSARARASLCVCAWVCAPMCARVCACVCVRAWLAARSRVCVKVWLCAYTCRHLRVRVRGRAQSRVRV